MRSNRIRNMLFISFLASAATLAAVPVSAQSPYDGLWQVTVVTKTGSCDAQTTSTVNVADGKISGGPVSGSVGSGGLVKVSINGAYANGQLSGNSGSGKWNGASAGVACSGRWEASRQYSKPDFRILRQSAAADIRSRRVFFDGLCGLHEPRPVQRVRRHGRHLVRPRHRDAG